ncbi:MAG: hypothetical protein Ct9H90mP18_09330 [Gammaproteobacteria bacterium]|nr:MAG: hypothetical protein Ct9H90mP18_09330 [Gammaproteobacteria bacterium]
MNKLSALLITSLASISSFADWEVNMPRGVSPTANAAYDLHMLIFYITVVIGVIVFGVMFYPNIPSQKIKRSQTCFIS